MTSTPNSFNSFSNLIFRLGDNFFAERILPAITLSVANSYRLSYIFDLPTLKEVSCTNLVQSCNKLYLKNVFCARVALLLKPWPNIAKALSSDAAPTALLNLFSSRIASGLASFSSLVQTSFHHILR